MNSSYDGSVFTLYIDANVSFVEQPTSYDTVLIDRISISARQVTSQGTLGSVSGLIPASLRGHAIPQTVLDSILNSGSSYQFIADTLLMGTNLSEVYYLQSLIYDGELFMTNEYGIAAVRVDGTLWIREL